MKYIFTLFGILLSILSMGQIDSVHNKYDSLLMKEVNMYRVAKGLNELVPSTKMRKEITNVHLKDIKDTLEYRMVRFEKFKKDNGITNHRSVPKNLKRKYSYQKAYSRTSNHPNIINCNENLSMVPGKFKSVYREYIVIYQFHRFLKNKKIKITDFIKQYRDFFGVVWNGNRVTYKYDFKTSTEYKEFESFVYKDGFYIDKTTFEFETSSLCHSPQSFRLSYKDYLKMENVYIDIIGLDYDYLFNKETYNDVDLSLTKVVLTGFVYSPKHNEILLTENMYGEPLRNISTGSITIGGWTHTLLNFQNDTNDFFSVKDIRERRARIKVNKKKERKKRKKKRKWWFN